MTRLAELIDINALNRAHPVDLIFTLMWLLVAVAITWETRHYSAIMTVPELRITAILLAVSWPVALPLLAGAMALGVFGMPPRLPL